MVKQYLDLVRRVLTEGEPTQDRTGVGTISLLGHTMRFDLSEGFPLLTTKRLSFKSIYVELLWFLRGDTNIRYLLERGVTIWNEWPFKRWVESPDYDGPDMTDFGCRAMRDPEFNAIYQEQMKRFEHLILTDEEFARRYGDIGPGYGKQWRSWPSPDGHVLDQVADLVEQIRKNPYSRRLIVSAWNPAEVHHAVLPPCHVLFQVKVFPSGKLSLIMYQRSCDVGLGAPFNIASYALLTHMLAHVTGYEPGEFIHTIADAHIYLNHIDPLKQQLTREPRPLPRIRLNPAVTDLFDFRYDVPKPCCREHRSEFQCPVCGGRRDVILEGYNPHPSIKMDIAV